MLPCVKACKAVLQDRGAGTSVLSGCLQAFWNAFQHLSVARSSVLGAACGGFVISFREGCSCPLAIYSRNCSVVQPARGLQRSEGGPILC